MRRFTACIAVLTAAGAAPAQTTTEYGIEFSTIGDPGNRETLPDEGNPIFADRHLPQGSVGYTYRIATRELTVGHYFEFVQAYAPIYFQNNDVAIASRAFTGRDIHVSFAGILIRPSASPDVAAEMSWEYAARYVNWLHNGKVNDEWAFETGVYDTSTFTQNPDGSYSHQVARNPGARFWIPSADEWIKAAHWDPEKDNGEGGYWLFPNSSDTQSVPGLLPSEGGERNAGPSHAFPLSVGSFPHVQSPWGLLDLEGGAAEWSETIADDDPQWRLTYGSTFGEPDLGEQFFPSDLIGFAYADTVWAQTRFVGLRLAAAPPCPTDFNLDGVVDAADLARLVAAWGAPHPIDLDGDQATSAKDLLILIAQWGACE